MQYNELDASLKIQSLDVPFHYHHALTPTKFAIYNHQAKEENEWSLKIGDKIYEKVRNDNRTEWFNQASNDRRWDGYFYGVNHSMHNYKLYPNYKMRDDIH